jgi:hypothetical protein
MKRARDLYVALNFMRDKLSGYVLLINIAKISLMAVHEVFGRQSSEYLTATRFAIINSISISVTYT